MSGVRSDLGKFPGGDIVAEGLADLAAGRLSVHALAVLVASPRLTALGIVVPQIAKAPSNCEHELYEMIARNRARGAHAAYNAIIDRLVSFASAYASARQARNR